MEFGLSKYEIDLIRSLLEDYPEVHKAVIFGSRALGTEKKGSDVDIAVFGDLDLRMISSIKYRLEEELPLPYFFDVVDYMTISDPALKEHIDRFGKVLYTKSEAYQDN